MKIAKGIQKSGQTKEQTKLISQGIQKGIDQYKKQHNAKARELDKRLKKASNAKHEEPETVVSTEVQFKEHGFKEHWLPWLLLVVSWGAFLAYVVY